MAAAAAYANKAAADVVAALAALAALEDIAASKPTPENKAEWDLAVAAARKKWQTYAGLARGQAAGSITVAVPERAVFELRVDTADARLQLLFDKALNIDQRREAVRLLEARRAELARRGSGTGLVAASRDSGTPSLLLTELRAEVDGATSRDRALRESRDKDKEKERDRERDKDKEARGSRSKASSGGAKKEPSLSPRAPTRSPRSSHAAPAPPEAAAAPPAASRSPSRAHSSSHQHSHHARPHKASPALDGLLSPRHESRPAAPGPGPNAGPAPASSSAASALVSPREGRVAVAGAPADDDDGDDPEYRELIAKMRANLQQKAALEQRKQEMLKPAKP